MAALMFIVGVCAFTLSLCGIVPQLGKAVADVAKRSVLDMLPQRSGRPFITSPN